MSKVNYKNLLLKKNKSPITCLTAYSKPIANLLDGKVDLILVGDSVGTTLYGMKNTRGVTLEMMKNHGKAVVRNTKYSMSIIDMPFNTYRNKKEALKNANKLISKGHLIAWEQFRLPISRFDLPFDSDSLFPTSLVYNDNNIIVNGDEFSISFSLENGFLNEFNYRNIKLFQGVLQPFFWRAPTDNDLGNNMPERCFIWKNAHNELLLQYLETSSIGNIKQIKTIHFHVKSQSRLELS